MSAPTFDARAMLRYLVGWFTIRREEPAKMPSIYVPNETLFCSAHEAGLVAWVVGLTDHDGAYDLTDAGVEWIRQHLLVDGFRKAKCESCSTLARGRNDVARASEHRRHGACACALELNAYSLYSTAKKTISAFLDKLDTVNRVRTTYQTVIESGRVASRAINLRSRDRANRERGPRPARARGDRAAHGRVDAALDPERAHSSPWQDHEGEVEQVTKKSEYIKQAIARWIHGSLDPSESPRCPDYPDCGGEDGSGHLQKPEHRNALTFDHHGGLGTARKGWADYTEQVVKSAPKCKECQKFVRAVDRAITKLTDQGWP